MSYTKTLTTVKAAAAILGLAENTVYHGKAGTNKLTRIRQGRSVRLIRQEVEAYLEQLIKNTRKVA